MDEKQTENSIQNNMQFKDIKSSYLYWRNVLTSTSRDEFNRLKNLIILGKLLLNVIDTKDEETIKKINETKEIAIDAYKIKLEKPDQKYDFNEFGGKRIPLYNITSEDGGSFQSLDNDRNSTYLDFKESQFENYLDELYEVDEKISELLNIYDIIPSIKPDIDDLIDRSIKNMYDRRKTNNIQTEEKNTKENTVEESNDVEESAAESD